MKLIKASTFISSFIIALLAIPLSANALILEPGLWEIDMTLKQNGKEINPMQQLQEAMKDMPEERKKQMMQAMEESGMSMKGPKDMRQCYTKEMIEKAKLGVHEDENCRTETVKKSDKKIVSKFTCKDGSKGTAVMEIKNKKSYTGHMTMTDAKGEVSELDYKAKFVSSDCGNIKPVEV